MDDKNSARMSLHSRPGNLVPPSNCQIVFFNDINVLCDFKSVFATRLWSLLTV